MRDRRRRTSGQIAGPDINASARLPRQEQMRLIRPVALALLSLALAPAVARADDAPVGEQIIVRHRAGLDAAERAEVRADSDTQLDRKLRLANTELVSVTDGTRAQALTELSADPDVVWAAPNIVARATGAPDPYWSLLYGLYNDGTGGKRIDADVDAQQAWTVTRGAGATVAVVDTGVQLDHPDLAGRLDLTYAKDYVDDGTPDDGDGHGTHVAGIVAANRDNGLGVAGIAPESRVMPVRVLDNDGGGDFADVLDGFDWAASHGAQVVSASLGSDGLYDPDLAAAFEDLYETHADTLFVIAAGNDGLDNDTSPDRSIPCVSSAANVLCVGATDATDARASFSNYGASTVDLFAPGVDILSTYPGGYAWMDGTSMATPYVAGAAALAFAATGDQGADLAQRMKNSVDRPAALAGTSVTGGRLNAARAAGAPVDAPDRPVTAVATGGTGSARVSLQSAPADVAGVKVYDQGYRLLGSSTSSTVTVGGLPGGVQRFVVVATYADGRVSPVASAAATVIGPAPTPPPTPAPVTPAPKLPVADAPTDDTGGTDDEPAPVSGVRLVTHHGRGTLVFRLTRTTRVTVTLYRYSHGHYRRSGRRTVRMTAGTRSLRVTSRLLGMRVPHGRFKVRVAAGDVAATVASTRR
jgi:hypothetical protein